MPRLFVAIDSTQELRHIHGNLRDRSRGVRWEKPERLHLTLRFVGEVPEDLLPRILAGLRGIHGLSFTLRTHELVLFPDRKQPRVLAITVSPTPELIDLQANVSRVLEREVGTPVEGRPYRPHITIARFRRASSDQIDTAMSSVASIEGIVIPVTAFILYESVLRPEGPVYRPVERFPLQ
jgi:RNA 2',3'-cyclic 3'-phosphodiesterase